MKNILKKEFESEKWYVCFNEVEKFILNYGLDLIKLEIKLENKKYIATLEYGLGVRNG